MLVRDVLGHIDVQPILSFENRLYLQKNEMKHAVCNATRWF